MEKTHFEPEWDLTTNLHDIHESLSASDVDLDVLGRRAGEVPRVRELALWCERVPLANLLRISRVRILLLHPRKIDINIANVR